MEKKHGGLKKFFGEFKKFITRGNVLDMAVGVIVGGAFTAIVTALSDNILKPLINWVLALILGKDALSEVFTFLKRGYDANGVLSLENSIYIDWGAFINAIINFLIVAFVLFMVIKTVNALHKKPAEPEAPAEPTTKVCPYCQSEIAIKAVRCPHCTTKLEGFPEIND